MKVAQHVKEIEGGDGSMDGDVDAIIDEVSMLDVISSRSSIGSVGPRGTSRTRRSEGFSSFAPETSISSPPVSRGGGEPPFVFDCDAWRAADFAVVELVKVLLGQRDQRLVDALNEVRVARVSSATCALFRSLASASAKRGGRVTDPALLRQRQRGRRRTPGSSRNSPGNRDV